MDRPENTLFIGELSVDGTLRQIDGVLPMSHMAHELGIQTVYLPAADAPEAALIRGLEVISVPSLSTLVSHLRDFDPIPTYEHSVAFDETQETVYAVDYADIEGQEHCKRTLEVAAAGAHNCLMTGSPDAGKTLMDKVVTISRAQGSLSFPANFMFVGAMNPCPCGWFGDNQHECTCNTPAPRLRPSNPLRPLRPPRGGRSGRRDQYPRRGAAGGFSRPT